jgi:hypothetical protein
MTVRHINTCVAALPLPLFAGEGAQRRKLRYDWHFGIARLGTSSPISQAFAQGRDRGPAAGDRDRQVHRNAPASF